MSTLPTVQKKQQQQQQAPVTLMTRETTSATAATVLLKYPVVFTTIPLYPYQTLSNRFSTRPKTLISLTLASQGLAPLTVQITTTPVPQGQSMMKLIAVPRLMLLHH